jgi:hypothetical protein
MVSIATAWSSGGSPKGGVQAQVGSFEVEIDAVFLADLDLADEAG